MNGRAERRKGKETNFKGEAQVKRRLRAGIRKGGCWALEAGHESVIDLYITIRIFGFKINLRINHHTTLNTSKFSKCPSQRQYNQQKIAPFASWPAPALPHPSPRRRSPVPPGASRSPTPPSRRNRSLSAPFPLFSARGGPAKGPRSSRERTRGPRFLPPRGCRDGSVSAESPPTSRA